MEVIDKWDEKRAPLPRTGYAEVYLVHVEYSTSTTRPPRPRPAAVAGGVPRPARRPSAARPGARPRQGTRRRPPVLVALSRLPRPRLTGLGCGVLVTAVMIGTGWLSRLFGGAPAFYGVVFLLAATAAAVWVRPSDLICAPIAAPIAYAAGVLVAHGMLSLVTELALGAPWLFAGTLVAAAIVTLRLGLLTLRRITARRRAQGSAPERRPAAS